MVQVQTEMRLDRHSSVTVGYLGVNGTHLTRTHGLASLMLGVY
jgi:hypothetical protein